MLGLGALPKTVARINYRLVHIPLQLIEDVAMSQLDEAAPTRLAYEQVLIECDRAAAHLFDDQDAAARAAALHAHTAAVRLILARRRHRAHEPHRADVIALDQHRALSAADAPSRTFSLRRHGADPPTR